jgi:ABC-2 type transport system ATP-binding protein
VTLVQARGLRKSYGSTRAVDDLTFDVRPGTVTGFLGPNGAGKSTTIRLMLGLDRGGGTTTYDGKPFAALDHPMRRVGTLLEAKAFHPTRSARNHLRMLAAPSGVPLKRVDEVIDFVGLASVAGKKPKGFSLGMGQRLGLAAALLGEPDVLILDEPANGLDPAGINWLRQFLKDYARTGRSVFVSSHLLAEMSLMADHLVVIGRGSLRFSGPVDEFLRRARGTAVVVRGPDLGPLAAALPATPGVGVERREDGALAITGILQAAIGDLAFAQGVVIHELMTQTASLEEAFLELTGGAEEFTARGGHPPELGTPT